MLWGSDDNELKVTLQNGEFQASYLLTKDKSAPLRVQQQNSFSTWASRGQAEGAPRADRAADGDSLWTEQEFRKRSDEKRHKSAAREGPASPVR